jgi:hypothetical protein
MPPEDVNLGRELGERQRGHLGTEVAEAARL